MLPAVVIDPAVLAWDNQHFTQNKYQYWDLAAELMTLIEAFDRKATNVVVGAELAELLVNAFPASDLHGEGSELRDFVRIVFSFLSRACADETLYPVGNVASCMPNLLGRGHFSAEIVSHFHRALLHAGRVAATAKYIATHPVVWHWPAAALHFVDGADSRQIERLSGEGDFVRYRDSGVRIYEASPKHHPVSGFGSKLPAGLSTADYQRLLNQALEVNEATFCVFSLQAGVYLVFRSHHQNYFHGYPILWTELTKMGISRNRVPRI